nr:hypothetical protein [Hyphomonas sp. Mor2]
MENDPPLANLSALEWLYHFQSLVADVLALIAAIVTIWFLHQQSLNTLKRDHNAGRANLPLALSSLIDYADRCLSELTTLLQEHSEEHDIRAELEIPVLPEKSLRVLTELVRTSEKSDSSKMQSLLKFLQVYDAKLRGLMNDVDPERPEGQLAIAANVRPSVLDASVLQGMVNHMFEYARWEQQRIPAFDPDSFSPVIGFRWHQRMDEQSRTLVLERSGWSIAYWFNE